MAEEKEKSTETETAQAEKIYTQNDMLIYCGIAALVGGVLGYLIGENRGEKKSREKFDYAVKKLKTKSQKGKASEEEFLL